jgi:tetratricopeptide (TPR) repeat protein
MLGKYTNAINTVNKAIKINPKFGYCYYAKACIYSNMNNKQEAVKNLSEAIKLTKYLKLDANTEVCFKNIKGLKQFSDLIKST